MSLQSASTTIDSLPDMELQYVLSFLGPNSSFARTCRRFYKIHKNVMGELGVALVRGVDGGLWDPKLFPSSADPTSADPCIYKALTKAQSFCERLGTTSSFRSDISVEPFTLTIDEGYNILKAAFVKVRNIWETRNLRDDDQFCNQAPKSVIADPRMVSYLFDMDRLACLIQQNSPVGSFSELKRLSQSTTSIYLTGKKLAHIPHSIGSLTALRSLDLCGNQLISLPREIGGLTALTFLFLRRNQLTSLPREIGNLTTLTFLGLGENQLTSLPREIGRLTALTELYLSSNQFSSLPSEMGKLTALRSLDLRDNPFDIGRLNVEILSTLRLRCRRFLCDQKVTEAIQQHDEGLGEPPTRWQEHKEQCIVS